MYKDYFGLGIKPFELLPNPEFIYMSRAHKRAMTYLEYGIRDNAGFILLTGEIGSGKTTLIRSLIRKQRREVTLSKIFNTRVDSQQLIRMINDDFGLEVKGKDKFELVRDLNHFLIEQYAAGRQTVLIIDEAQNLTGELLEEVRMLSNLESEHAKLLQIILVGQPELRKVLSSPSLVQLRQRISVNCHLTPLNEEECADYIFHRLEKAGNRDAVSFGEQAMAAVHEATRGIPRLINILSEYLLIEAFAAETRVIEESLVRMVVEEMRFHEIYWEGADETAASVQDEGVRRARPGSEDGLTQDQYRRATAKLHKMLVQQMERMEARLTDEIDDLRHELRDIVLALQSGRDVAGKEPDSPLIPGLEDFDPDAGEDDEFSFEDEAASQARLRSIPGGRG